MSNPTSGCRSATAKAVKSVRFEGGRARVEVELGFPAGRWATAWPCGPSKPCWRPTAGSGRARVDGRLAGRRACGAGPLQPLPGIAQRGRRGVGQGRRRQVHDRGQPRAGAGAATAPGSGLLDADIYGPSQPRMMGLHGRAPDDARTASASSRSSAHGIKVMSIGFLIEEEQPMVWRGPMVTQALTQLLDATRTGATSTTWSWTCRPAPATSSSRWPSACR